MNDRRRLAPMAKGAYRWRRRGGQRPPPSPGPPAMPVSDASPSVDPADVARFEAIGEDWWDPSGSMRALHQINPLRIAWLRDLMAKHFNAVLQNDEPPLAGLSVLDIGCGAGLLSEPLARLGAKVTGLDPAPGNIEVARGHATETGADLSYRAATLEQ